MLVNGDDVRRRWREYFVDLLNRPEPDNPVDERQGEEEDEIGELEDEEIRKAIRGLKTIKQGVWMR